MANDPLPSWNETSTKRAIMDFVEGVTNEGRPNYVPPAARVATFDNDGTLWSEKPMPIQLDFIVRRLAAQAQADPSLRERQPWKASYEKDFHWFGDAIVKHYAGDESSVRVFIGGLQQAFGGTSIEQNGAEVVGFFKVANHPMTGRPYRSCGYQPMIELLRYLEANGFMTYIASGGGRDFMRPIAGPLYGIPPERIIGSTFGLEYQENEAGGTVIYKPELDFLDDGPEKPVRIWSRVGRRPLIAGGNSNGDIPMLQFASSPSGKPLRLLVLHDDAEREFNYVAGAEESLKRAKEQGWTVISIKNDWNTVYVPE
jgi:hypothetical protein